MSRRACVTSLKWKMLAVNNEKNDLNKLLERPLQKEV